jgi:hypothetical protein
MTRRWAKSIGSEKNWSMQPTTNETIILRMVFIGLSIISKTENAK